ncbi:MAG: IscS subfamily cysteine desulfurase [Kiloniellales bacterium]|nr:IscS subfamily cysteine desulfurase [Kiloniellales bacterium]
MQERSEETPIYLDNQATTPLDPRVLEAMMPYLTGHFGNPHSVHHAYGWKAVAGVEAARAEVAELIAAESREVVFTSGATESNNLAIKGAARFLRRKGKTHVVTLATEHKCVLECCRRLEREGFRLTVLPVEPSGLVDLQRLNEAICEDTALVSVMAVNNEIGVIQPLAEIGALCREAGAVFHCDAAQAVGKIPIDVEAMKIDLLSISGHKVYGPKGVGALYVRRRPRVRLEPLFDGGGQERGLRSGTLAPALCVGLGKACVLAGREMAEEAERLLALRGRFRERIMAALEGVSLNGDPEQRVAGNLNLAFEGVDGEALIDAMPKLAVSSGSACSSAAVEPSYVLRALGLSDEAAHSSIRIGLGRFTTEAEVDLAIEDVTTAVTALRRDGAKAEAGRATAVGAAE